MEGMANISDDASNGENGFLAMFGGNESGGGGIKVCGGQGCWRGDEAEKISLSSEKKLFSHSFSR